MNLMAMSLGAIALVVLAVADWYVWQTRTDNRARRFLKLLRS
jgi:membrane-anchored protein YejM (alkaline phosphatase superfamily)